MTEQTFELRGESAPKMLEVILTVTAKRHGVPDSFAAGRPKNLVRAAWFLDQILQDVGAPDSVRVRRTGPDSVSVEIYTRACA